MKLKGMFFILTLAMLLIVGSISSLAYNFTRNQSGIISQAAKDSVFYMETLNKTRQAQVDFQRQVQEWKNILIRGNNNDAYAKYLKGFTDRENDVQKILSEVKAQLGTRNIPAEPIDKLLAEHKKLGLKYREALQTFNYEDPETGKKVDKLLQGIDRPTSAAMDEASKSIQKMVADNLSGLEKQSAQTGSRDVMIVLGSAFGSFALALFILVFFGVRIYRTVGAEPVDINKAFARLAEGDLSRDLKVRKGDRASVAAKAQIMQARLRVMIAALHSGAQELEDIEKGLEDQAEDFEKVALSIKKARLAVHGLDAAADRFKV